MEFQKQLRAPSNQTVDNKISYNPLNGTIERTQLKIRMMIELKPSPLPNQGIQLIKTKVWRQNKTQCSKSPPIRFNTLSTRLL